MHLVCTLTCMGHKGEAIQFTEYWKKLHRGSGSWRQSLGLKAEGTGHSKHRCVCTDMLHLKGRESPGRNVLQCLPPLSLLTPSTSGNVCMHSGLSHMTGMLLASRVEAMNAAKHPWPRIIQSTKSMLLLVNLAEHKRTRGVRWKVSHDPAPNFPYLK